MAGKIPPPPNVGEACDDMSEIENVSDVVYRAEWRSYDELKSGKVLKWLTSTYCNSSCPEDIKKTVWRRNPDMSVSQEVHPKYTSFGMHCHRYCKDDGCCREDYSVTENLTALV